MRRRKKMPLLLTAPLLLAGVSVAMPVAFATPASAAPHGCQSTKLDHATASSTCHYGPGQQRVVITCLDGVNGERYAFNGPWVQWYQTSKASCAAPYRQNISYITIQVR
ncbi:hypothetical protein [Streptomyces melanogenes]|uniref:hypothetical protein n=1 Tax=Streptomyces melanogenes TaxID=67326 RepID=UPI00167ECD12|nr:hypothetical protein [Streptomyces melanogenes]GGP81871.1 hypothetical protein GCM10010278_70660 [Streptomyces melanogenes]